MLLHLKGLRAALGPAPASHSSSSARDFAAKETAGASEAALDLLGLAIASLEKLELQADSPDLCQIAVLGPTQAGKSTLVNTLVGADVTTVSALAGHTRHARGAAVNVSEATLKQISEALAPAQRIDGDELSPTNLDQYSLHAVERVQELSGADLKSSIVWDTPDFDSLAADTYRRAVLAIAGLADVIVLIVSRDKYGDMAVWELLDRLAHLKRRSVFVVNKTDPATWAELRAHVEQTQAERLGGGAFDVATINHVAAGQPIDVTNLHSTLGALQPVATAQVRQGIQSLISHGWDDWVAPVLAEDAAQSTYREQVAASKVAFMEAYRRDYLADADRYDTFQRLLGELLVLLEIPMLARTMGSVRKAVTWPVRKLFGKQEAETNLGREPELLQEAAAHLLLELRMSALESAPEHPFWQRVAQRVSADQAGLLQSFKADAHAHHDAFQASVAEAAQSLYQRLQENPALLNSLRMVRASADAAGVVVALQTGGIGLADLVLTPVMLSLTTTLTESAAKTYVDQVVGELQEKQFQAVSAMLDAGLVQTLLDHADDPALLQFGALDAEELRAARDDYLHGASLDNTALNNTPLENTSLNKPLDAS